MQLQSVDDNALLLFRKDAGPHSKAQSYCSVSQSVSLSVCQLRSLLIGLVVSYDDFKENRFANLHRVALGFPSSRFFYKGTPSSPSSAEAALKGETNVQMLFQERPIWLHWPLALETSSSRPFHSHTSLSTWRPRAKSNIFLLWIKYIPWNPALVGGKGNFLIIIEGLFTLTHNCDALSHYKAIYQNCHPDFLVCDLD